MRTFYQYIESIIDPKRNPRRRASERMNMSEPEDDDYDPQAIEDMEDMDDENDMDRTDSPLGLTAQYPLAQASGDMRGFQVKSPKEMFKKPDAIDDKLSGQDLFDTLRNKLKTGERMTGRELDVLLKLLNKQDEMLRKPR